MSTPTFAVSCSHHWLIRKMRPSTRIKSTNAWIKEIKLLGSGCFVFSYHDLPRAWSFQEKYLPPLTRASFSRNSLDSPNTFLLRSGNKELKEHLRLIRFRQVQSLFCIKVCTLVASDTFMGRKSVPRFLARQVLKWGILFYIQHSSEFSQDQRMWKNATHSLSPKL